MIDGTSSANAERRPASYRPVAQAMPIPKQYITSDYEWTVIGAGPVGIVRGGGNGSIIGIAGEGHCLDRSGPFGAGDIGAKRRSGSSKIKVGFFLSSSERRLRISALRRAPDVI